MPKNDPPKAVELPTTMELPKIRTFDPNPIAKPGKMVELADSEVEVLRTLLDRDRTSKIVHGGLKSLLNFSDREAETLLNFLRRI
jgi:hypothetical protein